MRVSSRSRLGRYLMVVGAATPVIMGSVLLSPSTPVSAQTLTSANYTGRACAVQTVGLSILGIAVPDQCIGDSGLVPSAGGTASAPAGPINIGTPPLIGANVVYSNAQGSNGVSSSQVQVAGLHVLPAPPVLGGIIPSTPALLAFGVLQATTSVNCNGIQDPILTSPVRVSVLGGAPQDILANTPITLPLLGVVTLAVNDQTQPTKDNGNTASGTVLSITFSLAGVLTGRIAIAHAESDLTNCQFSPIAKFNLPATGSAPAARLSSQGLGLGAAVLPASAIAVILTGLMVVRRRRNLAQVDGDGN